MYKGDESFNANIEKLSDIVKTGAIKANIGCPILHIGNFESISRAEIESYSSIKNLIRKYKETQFQGKPLSIAVFGPPGSGKSFGVKEITKSILGNDTPFLEYNLSQYGDAQISSLFEAFHDIQDQTMNNKLPLVFFDEFDCLDLAWLKCFLMPMQDGEFLEHGRKRPLGKCIFVFAGGLLPSYDKFVEKTFEKLVHDSTNINSKKLPDFLSRIKGYVDITSVNPIYTSSYPNAKEQKDNLYIIKRAI
jgi:hypothetical protein